MHRSRIPFRLTAATLVFALGLTACWSRLEHEKARRTWEMEDHLKAGIDARDAVIRGDLPGAHQAGEDLALPDLLPGLDAAHQVHLDALRGKGTELAAAKDLDAAAAITAQMTTHCSDCHAAAGLETPNPWRDTPRDLLWTALVWNAEARWTEAATGLGDPGKPLLQANGWADRRTAMAKAMRDGSLTTVK